MLARLTSLTMSSPSPRNQSLSIAATRTTRSSSPPVDWEPAVQEAAQLLVHRFAPRGTAPETARCLLRRRKPTKLKHVVNRRRHNPQVNSNGALPDATFGSIKAAVTIQSADGEVAVTKERVDGLTTSQVSV